MKQITLISSKNEVLGRAFLFTAKPLKTVEDNIEHFKPFLKDMSRALDKGLFIQCEDMGTVQILE